jgi:hypothetical protein
MLTWSMVTNSDETIADVIALTDQATKGGRDGLGMYEQGPVGSYRTI